MRPFSLRLKLACALLACLAALAGTAAAATLHVPSQYSTITAAIAAANTGDTVVVAAGTYIENIVIDKSITLAGAWPKPSLIRPAVSSPNPPACSSNGASLCGGAESDIILVQADNVTIYGFTLDGNNPALTSGIVAGGVDIDARNGIITNHQIGVFNNLTVHHVTVKNIYLRGIYASSGGTFNFHDNIVQNVQADPSSIAMFNFGGSGTMALNYVSNANDAISSNWSGGTQYLYNLITNSGSGVHSDNAGGFGGTPTADLIQGNIVGNCNPGGYGIFVFVPYVAPKVQLNVVSNCSVGLAEFGNGPTNVTVPFEANAVDGARQPGSVGVLVTSDELSYGSSSASVLFTYNTITRNATGVLVSDPLFGYPDEPAVPIYATFHFNNIFGNTTDGLENDSVLATTQVNATCDWWGNKSGPKNPANPPGKGDAVVGTATFNPWMLLPSVPGLKPGCTP